MFGYYTLHVTTCEIIHTSTYACGYHYSSNNIQWLVNQHHGWNMGEWLMQARIKTLRYYKNKGDKTTNTTNVQTFPWDIMYKTLLNCHHIFGTIKHSPRKCIQDLPSGPGAYWSTIVIRVTPPPKKKKKTKKKHAIHCIQEMYVRLHPITTITKQFYMLWFELHILLLGLFLKYT